MRELRAPIDPYRLFFPLGIILGLSGVIVWPLFYFGLLTGYWGVSHAFLQSDGFLFSFIAGFLLTAIPNFTGTAKPRLSTQLALAAIIVAGAFSFEQQQYATGHIAFVAAYGMLVTLVIKRVLRRKAAVPETFSLIGMALLTGMLGAIVNVLVSLEVIGGGWAIAGKRSLTEGMTLMLVLGVGGFLGPRLLGFEKFAVVQISNTVARQRNRLWPQSLRPIYLTSAIILLLSIIGEYVFSLEWLSFVRATVATAVIFITVQPWRLPATRSTLTWCVWTSNILLVGSLWLVAAMPKYKVDMLHIMFIGSFTLLILAVGMRVTLSHGGHGSASEVRNWPLRIGLILGSIAMLARVGAPFAPASYSEHLALAAVLWMIGLGIWGWRLIRLILRRT